MTQSPRSDRLLAARSRCSRWPPAVRRRRRRRRRPAPPPAKAGGLPEGRRARRWPSCAGGSGGAARCWPRRCPARAGREPLRLRPLRPRSRRRSPTRPRPLYVAPRGRRRGEGPVPGALRVAGGQAAVPERGRGGRPRRRQVRLRRATMPVPKRRAATRCSAIARARRPPGGGQPRRAARDRGRSDEARCPTSGDQAPRDRHAHRGRRRRRHRRRSTPASRRRTMHDATSPTWSARSRSSCCSPRPALCQSRVCGPVVDIAEQVKATGEGEGVEFIHKEIYSDNEHRQGPAPAARPSSTCRPSRGCSRSTATARWPRGSRAPTARRARRGDTKGQGELSQRALASISRPGAGSSVVRAADS